MSTHRPMDRDTAMDHIDDAARGRLDAATMSAFEEACREWPDVATAFEDARALRGAFANAPMVPCPDDVVDRVLATVDTLAREPHTASTHPVRPARRSWRAFWRPALPLTAGAALLMMALCDPGPVDEFDLPSHPLDWTDILADVPEEYREDLARLTPEEVEAAQAEAAFAFAALSRAMDRTASAVEHELGRSLRTPVVRGVEQGIGRLPAPFDGHPDHGAVTPPSGDGTERRT